MFLGTYLREPTLEESSFFLREFAKLPPVTASRADYRLLADALKVAEGLPPESKISAYRKELAVRKLLPMTQEELHRFLSILGVLNILHTDRHFGVTKRFISQRDMEDPVEAKNDYVYPVSHWRAKYGVDWDRVAELFESVF